MTGTIRIAALAGALASLASVACLNPRVGVVPAPEYPRPAPPSSQIPEPRAGAVALAPGLQAEVVISDLIYPTSLEEDERGNLYVAEGGFVYGDHWAPARILRVDPAGELTVIADGRDGLIAPVTDLLWHAGRLLVSHRGKVSAIEPGQAGLTHLVEGLPSHGDHHNNQLAADGEGWIYVAQGTMTNAGVVGADNFLTMWVPLHPFEHDRPARDLRLRGTSYLTANPFVMAGGEGPATARTGAFAPFGMQAEGDRVAGTTKAGGTVLRFRPDGSSLEVVAWGFRNPVGLAWGADGALYAAENGFDERGSRPIANATDDLWVVRPGAWYGWPDHSAGVPVDDPRFRPAGGPEPELLLEDPPPCETPLLSFPPHSSPGKLARSPGGRWGRGALYLAVWGDMLPFTGERGDRPPAGPGVVRIDPERRAWGYVVAGRGTLLDAGPRRPFDVVFSRDGAALYVVDMGAYEVLETPLPVPRPYPGTGVVWRISRPATRVDGPPAGLSALPGRGRARAE